MEFLIENFATKIQVFVRLKKNEMGSAICQNYLGHRLSLRMWIYAIGRWSNVSIILLWNWGLYRDSWVIGLWLNECDTNIVIYFLKIRIFLHTISNLFLIMIILLVSLLCMMIC